MNTITTANYKIDQQIKRATNLAKPENTLIKQKIENNQQVSFGSTAAAKGILAKTSHAATSLILKINQSRLPHPVKAWSTYMIANVPILSNVVFKSPIMEGDLIFAITAALPFARTVSEVPERRGEAFIRDMSGFLIFLTCVRAVQGLAWEKPLKFMQQAKPLQALAKKPAINNISMVTSMFPDTGRFLSEVARVDKVDDVIKAALGKGNVDDALKVVFNAVKEPGIKETARAYFERVPRAKEHFIKALEAAGGSKEGLKSNLQSFNKLKSFRSLAGAIIGGIVYILVSGIGINLLNQHLAKKKAAQKQKTPDLTPKGIPFAAKMNQENKVNNSLLLNQPTVNLSQIPGGQYSNRNQFINEINGWLNQIQ
jgi:hypothetical protein